MRRIKELYGRGNNFRKTRCSWGISLWISNHFRELSFSIILSKTLQDVGMLLDWVEITRWGDDGVLGIGVTISVFQMFGTSPNINDMLKMWHRGKNFCGIPSCRTDSEHLKLFKKQKTCSVVQPEQNIYFHTMLRKLEAVVQRTDTALRSRHLILLFVHQ